MLVDAIWWRRITPNDYFNIEKHIERGPKGQLHIDVPNPQALLRFFEKNEKSPPEDWVSITIRPRVIWDAAVQSEITFRPRPKNSRYDIRMQNHFSGDSERHPAWTSNFGWPALEIAPSNKADAAEVAGLGLTVYLARNTDRTYLAGYTLGTNLPAGWPTILRPLFDSSSKSAGLIEFTPISLSELGGLSAPINPLTPHGPAGEVVTAVTVQDSAPGSPQRSGAQGYGLNPAERRVVERLAMDRAMLYFEAMGYDDVEDVGSRESFDIKMVKDGVPYIVEVKGTTSNGESVFLTKNEVAAHRICHPHNYLYLLYAINLIRGENPIAAHGTERIISAWEIKDSSLDPLVYRYKLP